jgi:SAM-dependent methyltransferase
MPGAGERDWDEMAELDPMWAVLSEPSYGGSRDEALQSFFATGEGEISGAFDVARELGRPERYGRALDFGCGLGRLSRALAKRFDRCVGVDVSPRMLETARRLNGDVENCEFVLNSSPGLGQFEDRAFDLVYSSIVLQHLPSQRDVERSITELVRVAAPGGLVIFQIPSAISLRYRLQPRRRLYRLLRAAGLSPASLYRFGLNPISVRALREQRVSELVTARGGSILRAVDDASVPQLPGRRYFVAPDG